MEYTIKEVKCGKNKIMPVPVFEDKSLGVLEEFLMTEVKNFKESVINLIESAKTSTEGIEFAGNVCLVHIENGIVRIEATLVETEIGKPVEISFLEFEEVVNSWITDTKK